MINHEVNDQRAHIKCTKYMTQPHKYVYIICIYHIYQDKNLAKRQDDVKNHFNIPNAVIKIISKDPLPHNG